MIKCVAIDDEPIALSIISEYCSRYGNIELTTFTLPDAGMEYISEHRPDLVFLDIEMNGSHGVQLARMLPEGTLLIFTTAYAEYALEGFNVNAIDFLHKPIFYPRFAQAVDKASAWLSKHTATASPDTITLKADHKNVIIDLNTIDYIEAMDNYVKVYRSGMPTVVSQITMKEIEAMLPADRFARIHRSYIVSNRAIESYSNRKVYLQNRTEPLPVGRKYAESIRAGS